MRASQRSCAGAHPPPPNTLKPKTQCFRSVGSRRSLPCVRRIVSSPRDIDFMSEQTAG